MIRFKLRQRVADLQFIEGRHVPLLEVAQATGINRGTLSKIANQRGVVVRTDVLDKLCAYFGCRIEDIVEFVSEDSPDVRSDSAPESAR